MLGDYKLEVMKHIKFAVNMFLTPLYVLVDLPVNIYQSLLEQPMQSDTAQLLFLQTKLQKFDTLLLENKQLLNTYGNSLDFPEDNIVMSRITRIAKSRLAKTVVINNGSFSGIAPGQSVIGDKGLIGVISEVTSSYSTVRLITDPLQYVPVINVRSGERAITKGLAVTQDKLIINFLPPDTDVKLGDMFATSGDGLLFGYGYHVGKVVEITQENQDFISVVLTPSQHIDSTLFVVVDKK